MFSGTFKPRLDDKGRLFLPAKFREAMGDGLVITRGQERSIDMRTKADFEVFAEKFQNASQTEARLRGYGRMLFALASEQVPQYASLEKDCVVIGIYNRIEIWEPQAWVEYTESQESAFSDVQEEIFPGF